MFLMLLGLALAKPAVTLTDTEVLIPWRDFQTLYEQGRAPEEKPEPAPRNYTLDRATYTGRVVGEGEDAFALVHLTMRGEVLKAKGWSAVPLLSTAAALQSAKINGKDAAIYLDGGYYTYITDQPGSFVAELDLAVSLQSADGETGFALPMTQSGATEVVFVVESAEALDFEVTGARGATTARAGNAHTVKAIVTSLGSLAVSWQREVKETVEKAQQARVYAETQLLLGVAEGVLQGRATVNYTVLHAGVDKLRVQLPKDVTVLEVEGPGIREWKVTEGAVDVALNFEALGSYRLLIDYERAIGAGTAQLPIPRVMDVAREKTWIGVDARSAVELVAGQATNATTVDVRELPAAIIGQTDFPVLLAWKARGGEVAIPLEVRTHPDVDMLVTLVDTALADTLITVDGRRMTHLRYAVRNNRNQFLRLALPEGAEVWSASVAGRGVKVAKGEGGVLVPLVRSDASGGSLSAFLVDVVYVENGADLGKSGTARMELPRVDAPTSQLQWTVYFPEDAAIGKKSHEGSVRHVEYFSASPQLPPEASVTRAQQQAVQAAAANQAGAGALGQGVEPVEVNLPLSGQVAMYEKMLVLDEPLWVSFEYRMRRSE